MADTIKVFLCCAEDDKEKAKKLYRKLQENGFDPWLDSEKLSPGPQWESGVKQAIENADFFVSCLSETLVKSRIFKHKKIIRALELLEEQPEGEIYLVSVWIEACELPQRLGNPDRIDVFTEEGFDKLVDTLNLKQTKKIDDDSEKPVKQTEEEFNRLLSALMTGQEEEKPSIAASAETALSKKLEEAKKVEKPKENKKKLFIAKTKFFFKKLLTKLKKKKDKKTPVSTETASKQEEQEEEQQQEQQEGVFDKLATAINLEESNNNYLQYSARSKSKQPSKKEAKKDITAVKRLFPLLIVLVLVFAVYMLITYRDSFVEYKTEPTTKTNNTRRVVRRSNIDIEPNENTSAYTASRSETLMVMDKSTKRKKTTGTRVRNKYKPRPVNNIKKNTQNTPKAQKRIEINTSYNNSFSNVIGMKFVYIPQGSFKMGSPLTEKGRGENEDLHNVILTNGFYLQTTEVTQEQWKKIMGNNPSRFQRCGDNCPVEGVSWNDAKEFINKLNELEGTNSYRLPTEAEWEYACRAGSVDRYYFGKDSSRIREYAWYRDNSNRSTQPVAKRMPNKFGLYDMLGNVFEWCEDWYGDYPSGTEKNPTGLSR